MARFITQRHKVGCTWRYSYTVLHCSNTYSTYLDTLHFVHIQAPLVVHTSHYLKQAERTYTLRTAPQSASWTSLTGTYAPTHPSPLHPSIMSTLLAIHRGENFDATSVIPYMRNMLRSILVTRDHDIRNPSECLERYTTVYQFAVNGHCREPTTLLETMDDALDAYAERIASAADTLLPHNSTAFAQLYFQMWTDFCADTALVSVLCKYPISRYEEWRGLTDAETVVSTWNARVIAHPTIRTALTALLSSVPQLQHLAVHHLQASELGELEGSCVVESVHRNLSGCAECLSKWGIAKAVLATRCQQDITAVYVVNYAKRG